MKKNIRLLLLAITIMTQFVFSVNGFGKGPSAVTLLAENFQEYTPVKPWKPANGWLSERDNGSWAIAGMGKNRILQYFGPGNFGGSDGENRLLRGNDDWSDMTVTVRVKLNGDSYAGITRVKSGGDTYDIFLTGNSNIALLRRAKPVDTTLATAGYLIKPDTFYTLKVVFSGSKIMIYMNQSKKAIITIDAGVAEQGHKPGGKTGLFCRSSTDKDSASFDDLLVTKP